MSPETTGPPGAQEISGVFRGAADGAVSLRERGKSPRPPQQTEQGIAARSIPTFVAGIELADLAADDERIVVLTADLASAGRTVDFGRQYPDRFFNIGVAEQNMVSAAAGMAACGLRPFVSTFASYLALLCCEQIRTDLAYTGMPVVLLAHHSGMALGYYGTSHHALEDLSAMRGIAGLTVVCAADANELRAILRASLERPDSDGPVYVRMGRGRDPEVYTEPPAGFAFGRAVRLREGGDIALLATGSEVWPCLQAADELEGKGVAARVVDVHTVSDIDVTEVAAAVDEIGTILTVEEHNVTGGLGGAVAEVVAEMGRPVTFRRAGVPDEHVVLGPPAALYAHYRLDAAGIVARVEELLATKGTSS
jgi:transketolase